MIVCALLLALGTAPVQFLLPVRTVVLAPGGTTVAVQVRVDRHPANRWLQLEVWLDTLRVTCVGWELHGEASEATQPAMRPLPLRFDPGRYVLRARVCTSVTDAWECGRERARASLALRVCGADVDDDGCDTKEW